MVGRIAPYVLDWFLELSPQGKALFIAVAVVVTPWAVMHWWMNPWLKADAQLVHLAAKSTECINQQDLRTAEAVKLFMAGRLPENYEAETWRLFDECRHAIKADAAPREMAETGKHLWEQITQARTLAGQ